MRDHFISSLTEIAQKNNNIILITGDLGFGVLDNFIEKYPKQFINTGVAEQNMTGIASGFRNGWEKLFSPIQLETLIL